MGPRRTQARRPGVCSMLSGGACCGDNSLSSSLLSGLRVRNIALSRARPPVVFQGRQPKGIDSPGRGLACAGLPLACAPNGHTLDGPDAAPLTALPHSHTTKCKWEYLASAIRSHVPHPHQGRLSRCSPGQTSGDVAARGRIQTHANASTSSSSRGWSKMHTMPYMVTIDSVLHIWGRLHICGTL